MTACLQVDGITVSLEGEGGRWSVLNDVALAVEPGESLGVVGESGAGKTTLALSVLGLLPPGGRLESGTILLQGRDLVKLREEEMQLVRRRQIGLVLQEPGAALDPLFTIEQQLAEALRSREGLGRREIRERILGLLRQVAFPGAEERLHAYPFELSGGEQQRVMIALALTGEPRLLICDEPTSALDLTVQAEIITLIKRLRHELSLSVLWIAHDLGVVAQSCDRVVVLYSGTIVEEATVEELFGSPCHPYTQSLVKLARQQGLGGEKDKGRLSRLAGQPLHGGGRPSGCVYRPRCEHAMPVCAGREPALYVVSSEHRSRCYLDRPEGANPT